MLSRLFNLSAMFVVGLLAAGCMERSADEPRNAVSDAELMVLADRYLNEEHETDEESQNLLAEIERLSSEDSYRFFVIVDHLQFETNPVLADEEMRMRELSRAINEYAHERGIGRLHLTREQAHEAMVEHLGLGQDALDDLNRDLEEQSYEIPDDGSGTRTVLAASCSPGYSSCNTVSYTSTAWGGSCGSGCINGYSNDRFSNELCEFGGCDHRIFYPSASLEDAVYGETSLAFCVINYYGGGIISRYAGGYTQLGYGIGGPAYCGIWSNVGPYLRDNTQVF